MENLKVSSQSNPNSVAGAMAGVLRRHGAVEVTVVGAGALNQAIKAVAIARMHVAADGLDAVVIPRFIDVDIDGSQRTGIYLLITHRPARPGAPGVEAPPPVIDLRERPESPVAAGPPSGTASTAASTAASTDPAVGSGGGAS